MYRNVIKALIDHFAALVLLVIFLPVLALFCMLLSIVQQGQVFFLQERPGLYGKPFWIIKLKTMLDLRDEYGKLLPDNQRITTVGKWVRRLSIDELPQLINVLKGDMSLVGPRPLLFKYMDLYSDLQRKRHDVKPGITGLAQVSGRNSISWTKKFEMDTYYVENLSLGMDIKILMLTAVKVLKREGVNQTAQRPMEPFNGTN